MRVREDVLGLVHETPLVELKRISPRRRILAKIEFLNPSGSIKDRMALTMIDRAERRGVLKPGVTLVEATTGNTGISFAMVCAIKGYEFVAVMPASMSRERAALIKALGGRLVLTPARQGPAGAVRAAQRLAAKPKHLMLGQFTSPDNPASHLQTAAEIWTQTKGRIGAFVAGAGTGGTLVGVGRFLKQRGARARIVAVEPATCAVLSGGRPGAHKIQGIGEGFVPEILAENLGLIDEVVTVTDAAAMKTARLLMRREGLLAGISSGANVWAALKIAARLGPASTVVTVLPDSAQRYLSTELFE